MLAAESAYFLLAFVNIGLVADGGSSLLIPERVGFARAAEMAMLGERVPAPKALEWGLINRVVPDDELTSEADALADRLAAGPTRSYAGTKRQLNAWQFARMEAQLELEASIQQRAGRVGATSWRASRRSWRSDRPASRGADSHLAVRHPTAPRSRRFRPYTAGPRARRTYSPSPAARGSRGACGGPGRRPGRPCRPAVPGIRRLAERRQHQDALRHGLRARAVHLRGRRGHAAVVAVALPGPQGRHGRADPRQHEARDRLDRRRRRDPHLHHGLHLHQAPAIKNPKPSAIDANGNLAR